MKTEPSGGENDAPPAKESSAGSPPQADEIRLLRTQVACLEELLGAQEAVVAEQSARLRAERDRLREAEASARRALEALRESSERFELITETVTQVFWIADVGQARTDYVSPAYERLHQRSARSLYDDPRSFIEGIHRDDRERFLECVTPAQSAGLPFELSYRVVRPDGSVRTVMSRGFPVAPREGEKVTRYVGIMDDVTDRLQAETRSLAIIELARDGTFLLDGENRIIYWNRAAATLLGLTSATAFQCFTEAVVEASAREAFSAWATSIRETSGDGARLPGCFETRLVHANGESLVVECSGAAIPVDDTDTLFVMSARDVTAQRRLEFEHGQAQKLEAVGRLASGIAHEINTPIQFISDSVHFVRDAMNDLFSAFEKLEAVNRSVLDGAPSEEAAKEANAVVDDADIPYLEENVPKALDRALDGLNRVAQLVRAMKEFAHPDQASMAPANLNEAIQSTLTIARNEYKYVADLETDFGELPPVMCHVGEVNQVVLNLVVNAAHAIADVKGENSAEKGRITVRTRRVGESVVVTIGDTGGGIPEHVRGKIFEPFFTTKEVGRGTGQGLAIARSVIVDKHGGELTFETEVGRGTEFFLRLPVAGRRNGDEEGVR